MKYLDFTFDTPAENLACDEALLDACEAGELEETLRFWRSETYFVAVGYGNRVATEVNLEACAARGIPVLRRCSGGGTVLQGPGVLNYALILDCDQRAEVRTIGQANRWIMEQHRRALAAWLDTLVEVQGHTDLAMTGRKFSGNAQRRKRRALLFHGTFLLDVNFDWIEATLQFPSWSPAYRAGRSHCDFLMNLRRPASGLITVLRETWAAAQPLNEPPLERVRELVRTRYATAEWNRRL